MNSIALTDWVATLESGSRPKGGIKNGYGEVPSLGAEHLSDDGGFNFAREKRIPFAFYESLKKGRIEPYDILIVKDGATTGKVSFVNDDFPYEHAAINEHVFRLVADAKKADPRFVFRYLQSAQGQAAIMRDFRGATVGGIGRTFVDKVFLPDIDLGQATPGRNDPRQSRLHPAQACATIGDGRRPLNIAVPGDIFRLRIRLAGDAFERCIGTNQW